MLHTQPAERVSKAVTEDTYEPVRTGGGGAGVRCDLTGGVGFGKGVVTGVKNSYQT